MKNKLSLILIIFVSIQSFTQNTPIFNVGDTIYYDQKERLKPNKTSDYIVVKTKSLLGGKVNYNVDMFKLDCKSNVSLLYSNYNSKILETYSSFGQQIFYNKNGTKVAEGETVNNMKLGNWMFWYSDGSKKAEYRYFVPKKTLKKMKPKMLLNFWDKKGKQTVTNGTGSYFYISDLDSSKHKGKIVDNKKIGIWIGIRKDSSKIYKEIYKKGKLLKGESWDKKGKKYKYKKIRVQTTYKSGMKGIIKILSRNFRMPKIAEENSIKGTIYVAFIVDKNGNIDSPKVVRKLCVPCDAEAIRVVKLMKKWKPAMFRGQKVRTRFSIPITFK